MLSYPQQLQTALISKTARVIDSIAPGSPGAFLLYLNISIPNSNIILNGLKNLLMAPRVNSTFTYYPMNTFFPPNSNNI